MNDAEDTSSTRPYLIRALYEWCTDNGFTPYMAVQVDETVRVPNEYVKDGEIVLNLSFDATSALKLGNEYVEFKARFSGTARQIIVPVNRVSAIYARENGQGMAFPVSASTGVESVSESTPKGPAPVLSSVPRAEPEVKLVPAHSVDSDVGNDPRPPVNPGSRPSLKRVK